MKIKVCYGFHGRLRNLYISEGELIEETDKWLVILMEDGKKRNIELSHILCYKEI